MATTTTTKTTNLSCDYLLIGSGAAGLAFLDTLLEEQPEATVVLVDRKPRPGGHWVDDYDFVRLHQPSIVYGIASKQLEGNWLRLLVTRFMLPWKHRASKREILDYFGDFVDAHVATGRLRYFPNCSYDFAQKLGDDTTTNQAVVFSSLDGKETYNMEIRRKLVNGVHGECIIPSLSPPKFPVDDGITVMTPNEIFDLNEKESKDRGGWKLPYLGCVGGGGGATTTKDRHFVVLGCGKTAMDTVVFLQATMGVSPSDISWVIPNDVWMLSRDNGGPPDTFLQALLDSDNDKDKACIALEENGQFLRLDKTVTPTRFRFPVVGNDELAMMRRIEHTLRGSRVSAIRKTENAIAVSFEKEGVDDWILPETEGKERIFVHCTSPGPWNGKDNDGILFRSEKELVLKLLYAPPVSLSLSCLAKLESALAQGTLDVAFGRRVLGDDTASGNDVLRGLIRSLDTDLNTEFAASGGGETDDDPSAAEGRNFLRDLQASITRSTFVALLDEDPLVGYEWFKQNRLSMIGIPGFPTNLVEDIEMVADKAKELGAPDADVARLRMVVEKLEPLRGIG